jgi:shikimate kinase
MTDFIKKKIEVEEPAASMTFRPGQFKREPFSLQMKNIYLLGMRGSGKTTVGKRLAEALQCAFVDTDALVVAEAGQTIEDIVAASGCGQGGRASGQGRGHGGRHCPFQGQP